ncbi:MAG: Na-translocating system protein MpsC family protein [Solirubrobacteraceae bacterium]
MTQPSSETATESVLSTISREMVKLFKEQFGRGPVKSRAYWAGPDVIVCVLEETLTKAEQNLVALGEHQLLRETRLVFQAATVPEFCAPVERATGRKVRAFMSAVDTAVDGISFETFVLHPEGYDGPGRAEIGAQVGEIGPQGRGPGDASTATGPKSGEAAVIDHG